MPGRVKSRAGHMLLPAGHSSHREGVHPRSASFTLPRTYRAAGRIFDSLNSALRNGADPLTMEVRDASGDWRPYHVRPSTPAAHRRLPPCLREALCGS